MRVTIEILQQGLIAVGWMYNIDLEPSLVCIHMVHGRVPVGAPCVEVGGDMAKVEHASAAHLTDRAGTS